LRLNDSYHCGWDNSMHCDSRSSSQGHESLSCSECRWLPVSSGTDVVHFMDADDIRISFSSAKQGRKLDNNDYCRLVAIRVSRKIFPTNEPFQMESQILGILHGLQILAWSISHQKRMKSLPYHIPFSSFLGLIWQPRQVYMFLLTLTPRILSM
jgi:hypothetical protein